MKRLKGFLLVEVILTVALVAGGLLFVTASFSVSKKILYRSRELFQTGLLLQEKMFELQEKEEIALMSRHGAWQDPPADWNVQVSPVAQTDLVRVDLEVSAPGKPGTGRDLETYLWKKA